MVVERVVQVPQERKVGVDQTLVAVCHVLREGDCSSVTCTWHEYISHSKLYIRVNRTVVTRSPNHNKAIEAGQIRKQHITLLTKHSHLIV